MFFEEKGGFSGILPVCSRALKELKVDFGAA
jgi:hypothetical protein